MIIWLEYFKAKWSEDKGQGLVEYALLLALVTIVVLVILALLGPAIGNLFSNIVSGMNHLEVTGF